MPLQPSAVVGLAGIGAYWAGTWIPRTYSSGAVVQGSDTAYYRAISATSTDPTNDTSGSSWLLVPAGMNIQMDANALTPAMYVVGWGYGSRDTPTIAPPAPEPETFAMQPTAVDTERIVRALVRKVVDETVVHKRTLSPFEANLWPRASKPRPSRRLLIPAPAAPPPPPPTAVQPTWNTPYSPVIQTIIPVRQLPWSTPYSPEVEETSPPERSLPWNTPYSPTT